MITIKLKMEIEISKLDLQKAIGVGWYEEYGEELDIDDIRIDERVEAEDLVRAMPNLPLEKMIIKLER